MNRGNDRFLVDEWLASGMSKLAFARLKGIPAHKLYRLSKGVVEAEPERPPKGGFVDVVSGFERPSHVLAS